MNCRHCKTPLTHTFLDLGVAPPSNAYLTAEQLTQPETKFPLKLYVCDRCWLVQTEDVTAADKLFTNDYAYFSSVSQGWLSHAERYCHQIIQRLQLDQNSLIVEVAANDGYLLKNFVAAAIPCLGIEPTDSTADHAEKLGIPILREFFGQQLAQELTEKSKQADLIIGNNVYAHVPDINDFTAGLKTLLKKDGTITLEFPHLLQLIQHRQFDTVYHEHFSYLSLNTVCQIFDKEGLRVFDVETLPTHGGSLRIYACHHADKRSTEPDVIRLLAEEKTFGLSKLNTYTGFQGYAEHIKQQLIDFLTEQKRLNKSVIAYGAAAKGNTLLNYAGISTDLLPLVVDAAASKQGKYLPGSHIPILAPDQITLKKPDFVLILPWNIAEEVMQQQSHIREWGGQFVTVIPELQVSS
ncbi:MULTISPECIES: class I SAM-dependent methyltransferase [unclassified Methylophaga]|uniref:class I SAM-dependent methyltransferase n=1 Tax=unclassified Methylophaga TaxID=2629249 RepID=UPI000C981735|nr:MULTISPECIES: class I SAM-dependent methyltransferase [unclassified Methylophaga]MAP26626.1 SAM-dependent methyltransferase [Methylophaga sp.]HBX59777.1 SAM-dependent methyltransferase [Methylophaga sp.]HCO00974.1 SAM-dependent methyltransferase [Methylophaga sp.]|tara:strand:- start:111 stop:1337 length:1227 start_codon:yes stop_codon:yes gene_type:complete